MSEPAIKTRDEALRFLLEFTDYEKITKYKYDIATFDLGRVHALMAAVGDPHRAFATVHIAGTKGKGSTAAMTQSILSAAGLRTGLFTSPHLSRIEERMTIDGREPSEQAFVDAVNVVLPYTVAARRDKPNESPTFFELVTAVGFRYFAASKVDAAVVEVGMGGRLDATNVVSPEACAITRIDYDHVERLGATLDKIAFEKGGIIKQRVPVVVAPQADEALHRLVSIADERRAPMELVGKDIILSNVTTGLKDGSRPFCSFDVKTPRAEYHGLRVHMLGGHQALNAACAVALAETFAARRETEIGEDAVRRGLACARTPARLEVFPGRPAILLDGAHNRVSMATVRRTLEDVFPGKRVVLLMGASRDKDAAEMFKIILPKAGAVIFSKSDSPRAAEPEELAQVARDNCGMNAECIPDAHRALDRALELAGPDDLVCITGSFFLAGMLRERLNNH